MEDEQITKCHKAILSKSFVNCEINGVDLRKGRPTSTIILCGEETPAHASGKTALCYPWVIKGNTYAVRIMDWTKNSFKKEIERYNALAAYIQYNLANIPPELVKLIVFRSDNEKECGIEIDSETIPFLLMEWVDGEDIRTFIADNLKRMNILRSLCNKWVLFIIDLKKYRVIYGDLAHPNILVVKNNNGFDLKLVDYDTLIFEQIKTGATITPEDIGDEIGHAGYEHPEREKWMEINANIINFSSIVIYLGIITALKAPDVWRGSVVGDNDELMDHILLSEADIKQPHNSKTIQELLDSNDPEIYFFTSALIDIIENAKTIDEIPSLLFLIRKAWEMGIQTTVDKDVIPEELCEPPKNETKLCFNTYIMGSGSKPKPVPPPYAQFQPQPLPSSAQPSYLQSYPQSHPSQKQPSAHQLPHKKTILQTLIEWFKRIFWIFRRGTPTPPPAAPPKSQTPVATTPQIPQPTQTVVPPPPPPPPHKSKQQKSPLSSPPPPPPPPPPHKSKQQKSPLSPPPQHPKRKSHPAQIGQPLPPLRGVPSHSSSHSTQTTKPQKPPLSPSPKTPPSRNVLKDTSVKKLLREECEEFERELESIRGRE